MTVFQTNMSEPTPTDTDAVSQYFCLPFRMAM
jgi:hypothetical protein